MAYGFTVTAVGRNLLMRLQAGDTMNISRVMVGNGILPGDTDPMYLTDLISPVALAASSEPVISDNILRMTVEYRNDMNGGLMSNFWLSEYGIFAKDNNGDEILLYYADLSDMPEPVLAWSKDTARMIIKRYPVEIIMVEGDVKVNLDLGSSVFVTHEELSYQLSNLAYGVEVSSNDVPAKGVKTHYYVTGVAAYYRPDLPIPPETYNGYVLADGGAYPGAVQLPGGVIEPLAIEMA